jgi:hypothetical protein
MKSHLFHYINNLNNIYTQKLLKNNNNNKKLNNNNFINPNPNPNPNPNQNTNPNAKNIICFVIYTFSVFSIGFYFKQLNK